MSLRGVTYVDVAEIVRQTPDAWFVRLEDGREMWFPRKQVINRGQFKLGDKNCTFEVTDWFARIKKVD